VTVADPTPIPLLDIAAQHAPIRAGLLGALERVLDAQAFILGPDVAAFEQEMAKYLGVKHAIGCANGSDALVIALQALGIGRGDEVITSAFSFFATAGSIARLGATPVFVDIDPETFNIDVREAAKMISSRTKAIMPVHLFGQMTPMGPVIELAKQHGLRVVEDAAQAVGAKENGAVAGTLGDFGCLSFFPSKNLGCLGDGGMVLTQDDALADKARMLRVHGSSKGRYNHELIGLNSRLDTLQAAALRVKLPHLEAWTAGRQRAADRYRALLGDLIRVKLPLVSPGMHHIYNQFTIRVPRRDALQQRFQAEKVGCAVYYPIPLHLQKCFAHLGGKAGDCPSSEKACEEVLSIPVYGELTDAQIERVASLVHAHARDAS
jgi:dTDP-4-amino-4,6-dideoxygalactose transaminase